MTRPRTTRPKTRLDQACVHIRACQKSTQLHSLHRAANTKAFLSAFPYVSFVRVLPAWRGGFDLARVIGKVLIQVSSERVAAAESIQDCIPPPLVGPMESSPVSSPWGLVLSLFLGADWGEPVVLIPQPRTSSRAPLRGSRDDLP